MIILTFILIALYIAFTATLFILNEGAPDSYSEGFYILEKRGKGLGYIFTGWCFVTGIGVAALMFEIAAGQWWQFLGLFAGGGLCFVGAAPLFKSRERVIHICGAGVCALASVTWMCLTQFWYIPLFSLLLFKTLYWQPRKIAFAIEAALFTSMFTVLLLIII
jgi:hypothetical protein